MTPAARLAAIIEVLDRIRTERARADQVMKAWAREHRFAGSGDRRAIADRVYQLLRARGPLAWRMRADDARALVLGGLVELDGLGIAEIETLFSGEGYAPKPLTEDERARLDDHPGAPPPELSTGAPGFVAAALEERFGEDDWIEEARALVLPRAPVDLRVNALAGPVEGALKLLAHEGVEAEPTPWSAWGLRLPPELAADIQKTRAFTTGWIEVQDEGSQIVAALAGAKPGWTVVDYCAGGGGKTLALAAQMGGEGRLIACDVNQKRLDAVPERLQRARAIAELRLIEDEGEGTQDLAEAADLVFVDAPCSGSGTWRRHPEGAWRLTTDDVRRLTELQAAILARASTLVKPGGRLVYVTCSILPEENEAIADAFAAVAPEFRPLAIADAAAASEALTPAGRARLAELAQGRHTLQLTPRRAGTDGFFVALFERSAPG